MKSIEKYSIVKNGSIIEFYINYSSMNHLNVAKTAHEELFRYQNHINLIKSLSIHQY